MLLKYKLEYKDEKQGELLKEELVSKDCILKWGMITDTEVINNGR